MRKATSFPQLSTVIIKLENKRGRKSSFFENVSFSTEPRVKIILFGNILVNLFWFLKKLDFGLRKDARRWSKKP